MLKTQIKLQKERVFKNAILAKTISCLSSRSPHGSDRMDQCGERSTLQTPPYCKQLFVNIECATYIPVQNSSQNNAKRQISKIPSSELEYITAHNWVWKYIYIVRPDSCGLCEPVRYLFGTQSALNLRAGWSLEELPSQDTLIQGSERVYLKFGCCFLWSKTWSGIYCCENDSDGRLSQIWGQNVSSTSLPCLPPSPLFLCFLSWRLRLRRGPSPCHLPQKPAGGKDFSAL